MAYAPERLRILLLAAGCDATDVGEIWSNHQWIRRLGAHHDITLLTYRKRNRPSAIDQLPEVRVVEWLDLPFAGHFDRFNSMLKPGYLQFYQRARAWIRRAQRHGESFDLVHQLSPLAIRYPSPATGFGMPLIVGPLAGSLETPASFSREFGGTRWYTNLRALDRWRFHHDPWLRSTLSTANIVIGVAPYVNQLLREIPIRRFEIMSETGVISLPHDWKRERGDDQTIRLLYVGRITRSKGVRDAVRAMKYLRDVLNLTLDVVGDGEDVSECRREAAELCVSNRIRFHGRIARQAVDKFYEQSDIFLFPSLREPSGNAVLEAMSYGLPMIVAANGGPGYVVDNSCGYRIEPREPQQYAADLAGAIRELAHNRVLRQEMGIAARKKIAEQFLWDKKVEWMNHLYAEVIKQNDNAGAALLEASPR